MMRWLWKAALLPGVILAAMVFARPTEAQAHWGCYRRPFVGYYRPFVAYRPFYGYGYGYPSYSYGFRYGYPYSAYIGYGYY